jgi:hypothetical protein
VGREGAAPKSYTVAGVDAVSLAEDSIGMTDWEPPESRARGRRSRGFPRNLGDLSSPSEETGMPRLTATGQAPAGMDALARGTNGYRAVEGDRRRTDGQGGVVRPP